MAKRRDETLGDAAAPLAGRVARFPGYLADRYRAWRTLRFDGDRAWYASLAESGQHPRAMVVACCDSRVDVPGLLGAELGELFMVRNVANLCPPYHPDHEHHSTSAAIEYAVTGLKVAHIIVLGHAQCGGVAAYFDRREGDAPPAANSRFIDRWMDILAPAYERMRESEGDSPTATRAERLRRLEQEGVLASLRNLLAFPFVSEAVSAGKLTLHGAWFDIAEGAMYTYDPVTETFVAI
ncbi:MAG: carbonic anhydrase [Pseudomonadota bacterium]